MSEWELQTCMHGIEEDLDYHSCQYCQRIARNLGYKVITTGPEILRKTYIFTSKEQVEELKKKRNKKKK